MSSDSSPGPDAGSLYQAALTYLARYAATEAGLRRVLERRIDRWARAQPDPEAAEPVVLTARAAVDAVVKRLAAAGAVSDAVFAESRARSLVRSGRSTRSVQMRLVAKGVPAEVARSVSATDAETELAAALVLARKRRIGPYRVAEAADAALRMKEMALLARAGFPRDVVERALETARDEAEQRIFELRR
jgi:regulatory protein